MKNRLWWSFTSLAALLCLLLITADVSLAQGQLVVTNGTGAGRSPETVYTPPARIPAGTVAQGLQFEGFNSNNYIVQAGEQLGTPNPDIAVGPNDMILIVNRNVARVPNMNSSELNSPFPPGSIYNPPTSTSGPAEAPPKLGLLAGGANFTGGAGSLASLSAPGTPITNRARLDAWLGASIQASVCPTLPRSVFSCVIDNATVRYDQLQGRFLVLMTVVDTGIQTPGQAPTMPRRASWVLLVSRFAVITYPLNAFGAGSAATAFGTSDPFITPATNPPAGGGTTGGPNDRNWMAYYGRDIQNGGYGTDGFSGPFGNINAISAVPATAVAAGYTTSEVGADPGTGTPPYPVDPLRIYSTSATSNITTGEGGPVVNFNCNPAAIVTYPVAGTTSYCYFPSGARLGYDNDNVTIISPVYNANVLNPGNGNGSAAVGGGQAGDDPATVNNAQFRAYAGTRVRVLKKAAIYIGKGTPARSISGSASSVSVTLVGLMKAGNSYYTTFSATAAGGDFYDLYSVTDKTNALTALTYATGDLQTPPLLRAPFTLMSELGAVADPIFWEPSTLRGRAMASYSSGIYNRNLGFPGYTGTPTSSSTSYLVGTRHVPYSATHLDNKQVFIQGIEYVTGAGAAGNIASYVPRLYSANTGTGLMATWQSITVEPFVNPANVAQAGSTALLNVGDDRPDRVIQREGHLYIARQGAYPLESLFAQNNTTTSQLNNATVFYDVVQKLTAALPPVAIISTRWRNTQAYAPMFEVPANVIRQTPISPINIFPFLEKLFVGTTNSAGANPAGCVSPTPSTTPTPVPPANTAVSTNILQYAGLYDVKCGDAAFVMVQAFTNPVTGQLELRGSARTSAQTANPHGDQNTNLFGLRAGAGIDPNDGSTWIYGAYGRFPFDSISGPGQWGTYGANYKMSFPGSDPYNNSATYISDVQPPVCVPPALGFQAPNLACSQAGTPGVVARHIFEGVQVLRQHGLGNFEATGPASLTDPALFKPDEPVTRKQMARLVVLSLMTDADVDLILAGTTISSFADIASPVTGADRYIEVMYRLGITKGCDTNDAVGVSFCPTRYQTRGEMSTFIIRAKMNNVFPTLLNGCPVTSTGRPQCPGSPGLAYLGDNFGYFLQNEPYFQDVSPTDSFGGRLVNQFYIFVQKMFELKITNGVGFDATTGKRLYNIGVVPPRIDNTVDGTTPIDPASVGLTRGALASFLARGFFY